FGEGEVRAAVVGHEDLTTDDELGGGDRTVLASAGDVPDLGVRERGGVKLHGRRKLILEHQEGLHLGHRRCSFFRGAMVTEDSVPAPRYAWVLSSQRSGSAAGRAAD